MESEFEEYIPYLDHIEKISFEFTEGTGSVFFWELIFLPNLVSLSVKLTPDIDINLDQFILDLCCSKVEHLRLDISPNMYPYDFEIMREEQKLLKTLEINIVDNPQNYILKEISKMNIERLNLILNRDLTLEEMEFLQEMLRSSSCIIEFNTIPPHQNYLHLSKIAERNQVRHQIQSRFNLINKVPGNLKFHFGVKRNLLLEESLSKKKKLK
jgi:hypothetical protein